MAIIGCQYHKQYNMKAQVTNTGIYTHRILPDTFNGKNGLMLNFRNASKEVLESEGFYDVVKPSFDPQTQTKGGLYFDEDNSIVTYDVSNIDFNQDVAIIGEDGEPTGETEKRYKIADIKAKNLKRSLLRAKQRIGVKQSEL